MKKQVYSHISYSEFKERAAGCRTLSRCYRPLRKEEARTFECTVGEFLASETYPVRYVSSCGDLLVQYNCRDAHAIRFNEFIKREKFMGELLNGWY